MTTDQASFKLIDDGKVLRCFGDWTALGMHNLQRRIEAHLRSWKRIEQIDTADIEKLDSVGALLLKNLQFDLKRKGRDAAIVGLDKKRQELLDIVAAELPDIHKPVHMPETPHFFYAVGEWAVDKATQAIEFISFIGELIYTCWLFLINPRRIKWRAVIAAIDETGYQALPIVALLSFLIGIVLAYQLAEQLKTYGADIFIVDVTGVAILREFGPLITAIILAGRTSTAFASLIGTMKVNEEIDALRTMGLSPVERLVLPRIIGLVIALPLLVVWADLFGILGSMVMSKNMLNISFHAFLERFEYAVHLRQYVLGLVKAPFFALIIAAVGCFQGFQVETSAESVGYKTTKAAVQAIFLIIIMDALFSIIFNEMGY